MIFYSPKTGGFYSEEIHGAAVPKDAVKISDDEHAELMLAQAGGKVIASGADGFPIAKDAP